MADLARVKDKVQTILASKFNTTLTDRGGFGIRHESAQLNIGLNQPGDSTDSPVWIQFLVPVLLNASPSNELYKYVALHADDYLIGHLSAFENSEGAVNLFMTHSLLGDYLDEEELISTVIMMLSTSNDLDDELQKQFGGTRFHQDS